MAQCFYELNNELDLDFQQYKQEDTERLVTNRLN